MVGTLPASIHVAASNVSFFDNATCNAPPVNDFSVGGQATLSLWLRSDVVGTHAVVATADGLVAMGNLGVSAATAVMLRAPATELRGQCAGPVVADVIDGSGAATRDVTRTVTLAVSSGRLFNDSACGGSGMTMDQFTLIAGTTDVVQRWVKSDVPATVALAATSAGLSNGTRNIAFRPHAQHSNCAMANGQLQAECSLPYPVRSTKTMFSISSTGESINPASTQVSCRLATDGSSVVCGRNRGDGALDISINALEHPALSVQHVEVPTVTFCGGPAGNAVNVPLPSAVDKRNTLMLFTAASLAETVFTPTRHHELSCNVNTCTAVDLVGECAGPVSVQAVSVTGGTVDSIQGLMGDQQVTDIALNVAAGNALFVVDYSAGTALAQEPVDPCASALRMTMDGNGNTRVQRGGGGDLACTGVPLTWVQQRLRAPFLPAVNRQVVTMAPALQGVVLLGASGSDDMFAWTSQQAMGTAGEFASSGTDGDPRDVKVLVVVSGTAITLSRSATVRSAAYLVESVQF